MSFHVPERFRIHVEKPLHGIDQAGNNGVFVVTLLRLQRPLRCIASDAGGWEHVSVSLPDRCPTWAEMCVVKDLFWDAEDTVVQIHPPRSEYVDLHPYCLHLWRPSTQTFAIPYRALAEVSERAV